MHEKDVTVILLAGGAGKRFGHEVPKQFLTVNGSPIALYSFNTLLHLDSVAELVVVCHPSYRSLFKTETSVPVRFALPGSRRQDSLKNGVACSESAAPFICVHDAARPLISLKDAENTICAAREAGAAVIGTPVKSTIKRCHDNHFVQETPDRSSLFEVQTPQVIRRDLIEKGLAYADAHGLHVTDDASLVEFLGKPVKVVLGSYHNIKVTTPDDLHFVNLYLNKPQGHAVSAKN